MHSIRPSRLSTMRLASLFALLLCVTPITPIYREITAQHTLDHCYDTNGNFVGKIHVQGQECEGYQVCNPVNPQCSNNPVFCSIGNTSPYSKTENYILVGQCAPYISQQCDTCPTGAYVVCSIERGYSFRHPITQNCMMSCPAYTWFWATGCATQN